MTNIFDINNIAFELLGYKMSWLELFGTAFGLWAVWLSAKEKIASWGIGLINVALFFLLFYQSQLYSDMFLQIYFFITNCYGWYKWATPKNEAEANEKNQLKVSRLTRTQIIASIIITIVGTLGIGHCMSQIHFWLPNLFPQPASFPYADTVVMVLSLLAQFFMAKKVLENWIIWIITDVFAAFLYLQKGLLLMFLEYILFCVICVIGYRTWKKAMEKYV